VIIGRDPAVDADHGGRQPHAAIETSNEEVAWLVDGSRQCLQMPGRGARQGSCDADVATGSITRQNAKCVMNFSHLSPEGKVEAGANGRREARR